MILPVEPVARMGSLRMRTTYCNTYLSVYKIYHNPDLEKLERGISEKVGVPVMLQHSAKGKGKLVLKYNNLDELDGILHHLGYEQSS